MKVRVDAQRCQGHTQCQYIAPSLFRLRDDDGHAEAIVDEVAPGDFKLALLARDSCPEEAICVDDE
jgi:ferredoxin